jgi:hypothetical protein
LNWYELNKFKRGIGPPGAEVHKRNGAPEPPVLG